MKITTGSALKLHKGNVLFQYFAAYSATLTIITSGMHYGWPSPSLPKLLDANSTLPITDSQGSWVAVMPLIGAVIGSLIVAVVVDILGRKRTILLSSFPFFAAWIMVAYSRSIALLYTARFVAGLADGWVFTAVPMYIGEIADPRIRGRLGTSVSVSWILGILLINVMGSYLSIAVTGLIASILPVLSLVTFTWMPESPYYLTMKEDQVGARQSLRMLRGVVDVDSELSRISVAVKSQMQNAGKFLDLFTVESNRRAVYVMMMVRAAQQLSGTTAITFYTQPIFEEAGSDVSPEIASIVYFSVQLVLAMFCSGIVDKAGRRPLMIVSITGSAVILLIEGTYFCLVTCTDLDMTPFSLIPVVALMGFVVVFSVGMQTIPLLMLGELFPANVKAFALCLADIYFAAIATVVSKFFQIMKDSFGMYVPFFAFSGCCVVGLICIVVFVPETKGKTLEEIQMYLKGEQPREKRNSVCSDSGSVLSERVV